MAAPAARQPRRQASVQQAYPSGTAFRRGTAVPAGRQHLASSGSLGVATAVPLPGPGSARTTEQAAAEVADPPLSAGRSEPPGRSAENAGSAPHGTNGAPSASAWRDRSPGFAGLFQRTPQAASASAANEGTGAGHRSAAAAQLLSAASRLYYGPRILLDNPPDPAVSAYWRRTTRRAAAAEQPEQHASMETLSLWAEKAHQSHSSSCAVLKSSVNIRRGSLRVWRQSPLAGGATQCHAAADRTPPALTEGTPYPCHEEQPRYGLRFVFDTSSPCRIRVLCFAKETIGDGKFDLQFPHLVIPPFDRDEGLGQEFELPERYHVDLARYIHLSATFLARPSSEEADLAAGNSLQPPTGTPPTPQPEDSFPVFPFVVVIESRDDEISADAERHALEEEVPGSLSDSRARQTPAQSGSVSCKLVTYVALNINMTSNSYEAKVRMQRVEIGGLSYILHEIYGLAEPSNSEVRRRPTQKRSSSISPCSGEVGVAAEQVVNSTPVEGETRLSAPARIAGVAPLEDEADLLLDSRECVVCMSEPKDTTVLPCRHLCLCKSCAETLRNQSTKCPICRAGFHALLRIVLPPLRHSIKATRDEIDEDVFTGEGRTPASECGKPPAAAPRPERTAEGGELASTAR